jgi:hypothetical protein
MNYSAGRAQGAGLALADSVHPWGEVRYEPRCPSWASVGGCPSSSLDDPYSLLTARPAHREEGISDILTDQAHRSPRCLPTESPRKGGEHPSSQSSACKDSVIMYGRKRKWDSAEGTLLIIVIETLVCEHILAQLQTFKTYSMRSVQAIILVHDSHVSERNSS